MAEINTTQKEDQEMAEFKEEKEQKDKSITLSAQETLNQEYVLVTWNNKKRLRKTMGKVPEDECCVIL